MVDTMKRLVRVDGQQHIIMNFTAPPSTEDLEVMSNTVLETLPEELLRFCDSMAITVEEIPDETTQQELELDDIFDLLALYKSGKEISPGVERKTANDDDAFILYRRPVLDMWCETGEDLTTIIRQAMIEELGRHFDFSDEDINEMTQRHYQGMF
jgi:predicted Zn-dependent protease with MMP-like domain